MFKKLVFASLVSLSTFSAYSQNFDSTGTNRVFAADGQGSSETIHVEGYGDLANGAVLTGTRWSSYPMHHSPAYFLCIVSKGASGGIPTGTSTVYYPVAYPGQFVPMTCTANTTWLLINPEQPSPAG